MSIRREFAIAALFRSGLDSMQKMRRTWWKGILSEFSRYITVQIMWFILLSCHVVVVAESSNRTISFDFFDINSLVLVWHFYPFRQKSMKRQTHQHLLCFWYKRLASSSDKMFSFSSTYQIISHNFVLWFILSCLDYYSCYYCYYVLSTYVVKFWWSV